jgi:CheY-like chemotaxis protein/HPt (histidine-containing phosphotransfer) domain-containing protein
VSCDEENEMLKIRINDTGIGLSEKQKEKLFKPFSQADNSTSRKYGGTGLGLHLSKQFAEMLGGDLTVESLQDVGSSFILSVSTGSLENVERVHECPDFETIEMPKISEKRYSQKYLSGVVLLTEDNIDNQHLVSLYLKRLGLKVEIANNGKEALEKVGSVNPDLVLMDIQMPVMDGLSATRTLRARNFNKPVVALTANALKQEQQECFAAGCSDVCTKPIDQERLIKVLSKYLTKEEGSMKVQAPIVSSLLSEDPEMLDLVEQFVNQLPQSVESIMEIYKQGELDLLKTEVHTLKGTCGNYGYQELFEIMKRIEFLIVTNNIDAIAEILRTLPDYIERIKKGLNPEVNATEDNVTPFPRQT